MEGGARVVERAEEETAAAEVAAVEQVGEATVQVEVEMELVAAEKVQAVAVTA